MRPGRRQAGFTLLEVLVVLGLLSGFLLFLVQMLATGASVFERGESGQELADRAQAASATVEDLLQSLHGPQRDVVEPGPPQARLLVQPVPLGLGTLVPAPTTFAVRAQVRIDAPVEQGLWRRALRAQAEATARTRNEEDVLARLDELVQEAPRHGVGTMLLLPFPADAQGEFLELRCGLFLPGEKIAVRKDLEVLPFEPAQVGGDELPADVVRRCTEVVAAGLLYVELQMWSQYTKDWDATGPDRAELSWDSARAGLLLDLNDERRRFTLDLGAQSLEQPGDDVFPRWIRATIVVGRPQLEGVLLSAVAADDAVLRVSRAERYPDSGFVKVGGEWIAYANKDKDQLVGLRRGQRGTSAAAHGPGAAVRSGKTVVLTVRVPHGRDCWNG
jgi:prepilin-type N-terminal cleavage/methylation domain-containing protein